MPPLIPFSPSLDLVGSLWSPEFRWVSPSLISLPLIRSVVDGGGVTGGWCWVRVKSAATVVGVVLKKLKRWTIGDGFYLENCYLVINDRILSLMFSVNFVLISCWISLLIFAVRNGARITDGFELFDVFFDWRGPYLGELCSIHLESRVSTSLTKPNFFFQFGVIGILSILP